MAEKPARTAVVIDGPEWWGDPSVAPDGRPVRLEDPKARKARRDAVADERAILAAVMGELPDDCLVIHTSGRGAGAMAAGIAAVRRMPVAAWPPFPSEDGIRIRNFALAAAVAGLAQSGWLVKAIIAYPDTDSATARDQQELSDLLRNSSIFVRSIQPSDAAALIEPDEETEPSPEAEPVV